MNKKFTALVLSSAMILSLAACSKGEPENSADKENGTEINTSSAAPVTSSETEAEDSAEAENNSPDILIEGETIFSEVSLGGYTARLELEDIVAVPNEELNAYQAIGRVMFTLTDESGRKAYALPNVTELMYGQIGVGVWADCTENALEIYEIEWNGEKRYVLRAYISYGPENGEYADKYPDMYHARFYVCDLDAAEDGHLMPYNIGGMVNGDLFVSDSLVYKEANILYDEKRQIEVTFNPDDYTAKIS